MAANYVVQHMEKKRSSKGNEFLTLKLNDVFVQFFDKNDVSQSIEIGQTVQCSLEQKGKYWNGKDLRVCEKKTSPHADLPSKLPLPNSSPIDATPHSSLSPSLPPKVNRNVGSLHNLTIAQLEDLYTQSVEKGDTALCSQISTHIRMARQITLLELIASNLQNLKK